MTHFENTVVVDEIVTRNTYPKNVIKLINAALFWFGLFWFFVTRAVLRGDKKSSCPGASNCKVGNILKAQRRNKTIIL